MDNISVIFERFFTPDKIEQLVYMGVKMILTYVLLMVIIYLERRLFKRLIEYREKQSVDNTNLIFIQNIVIYTTYVIGFLTILNQIPGIDHLSKTMLAGAGIFAAAIGFGSQQAISNIVSGIFMVIFKPFRVGDFIDMGGENNRGIVVDITLRHTKIRNNENRIIVIPNIVLNNQSIINSTIDNTVTCAFVQINIDYRSNMNRAIEIMREEAMKHPMLIDNRTEAEKEKGVPQVIVRVVEWENSSITLRAWAWAATTLDAFIMRCELLKAIKERFDKENIDIPLQYTNIKVTEKA